MIRLYELQYCAVCKRKYDECRIGKSRFTYQHDNIEEAKEVISFKVCRECRKSTILSHVMREVLQALQNPDKTEQAGQVK